MAKRKENAPSDQRISREPFPNSQKVYVSGRVHPKIKVAMREIQLSDSGAQFVEESPERTSLQNEAITVYDSSGPYTDPTCEIDIRKGLPPLRKDWILARGDVDELSGSSSEYASIRANKQETLDIRFPDVRRPLRASKGSNVSQMHYARKGVVTPEMEYVAIRENQRIDELSDYGRRLAARHAGESFGANLPNGPITPEFVRDEIAAGRAIIPNNINHPESEPMIIGRNFLVKINANIGNSAVTSSIEEEVEKAV